MSWSFAGLLGSRQGWPRCSSTRWFRGVSPSISQTSAAGRPSTSRSATTTRWRSGSCSSASRRRSRSSREISLRSGFSHALGGAAHRPGHGSSGPGKRSASTGDCVLAGPELGERQRPALTDPARLGLVYEDREDPRAQRRASFEAIHAVEDGQPGLLHDLLGERVRGDERPRGAAHVRVHPLDQRRRRRLVAAAQRPHRDRVIAPRGSAGGPSAVAPARDGPA